MANIVVITGGLRSLFHASLTLCQLLVESGHQVTYGSPKDLSEWLQATEIPFVQLPIWQDYTEAPSSRWSRLRRLKQRQHAAVSALEMDRFSSTLRSLQPDLLLIDIEMHPHIMTAAVNNIPVALLCLFVSIWQRPKLPPIHTATIPGEGWKGSRWGMRLSWLRYGWRKWQEAQRDRLQKVGCDRQSILYHYAKQIGYPFRNSNGFNQWLVPYPHKKIPILCLHGHELDFPHRHHSTMRYMGPMVGGHGTALVSEQDQAVLERLNQRDKARSLIYCGCSSMVRNHKAFLQQIFTTVQHCPQWDFVLGLGNDNASELPTTLSNLYAMRWAPQQQLLTQADCAIIHAGAQSIEECIHFGVPMLAYPLNINDQNGNAARVRYHGLGIVDSIESAQMEHALRELLGDVGYAKSIREMKKTLQHYSKNRVAIQIVESLLSEFTSVDSHLTDTHLTDTHQNAGDRKQPSAHSPLGGAHQ